jgi:hypothetical protein
VADFQGKFVKRTRGRILHLKAMPKRSANWYTLAKKNEPGIKSPKLVSFTFT